ncbi:MAG TPA: DUF6804 family protein, partial [Gemmataceae bacterium]|nr:DUF6804 family protein [Gemmataceae bacterium]
MADEPIRSQAPASNRHNNSGQRIDAPERQQTIGMIPFLARRPLILPAAVAVAMLIGAAGPRPNWYFSLLRWVVCAAAVGFAAYGSSSSRVWAGWVFGILAILFNPLVPVRLSRSTWQFIDIASAIGLAAGAILITAVSSRQRGGNRTKRPNLRPDEEEMRNP